MADTRKKDVNWAMNILTNGKVSTDDAQLAVLMDIRDELKRLNSTFSCYRFQEIPNVLDRIKENTRKPKRKKPVRKQ